MPNATDPHDCVCQHLRRAARSVTAAYDDALRPSGLRATQFTLLHLLSLKDGIAVMSLAKKAGMDRTTMTRGLQTLEQSGFVSFSKDAEDKRKALVHLTPEGQVAMSAAWPLWQKAQTQILKALSAKSWDKLYKRLAAVEGAVEAPRERGLERTKAER